MRGRIRNALKTQNAYKNKSTIDYLNCSMNIYIAY